MALLSALGRHAGLSLVTLPLAMPSLASLIALHRQRRALADLDDRALADLGLSRELANKEARRPLWDVPDHWQR